MPRLIQNALRADFRRGYVYLNNPKVGCSTVKTALWWASGSVPVNGNVHDLTGAPFVNVIEDIEAAESAFVFTFVRNPFQRIVSAYLNKVADKPAPEWLAFAKAQGLPETASLDAFVEAVTASKPDTLDPHWRPQHGNILYPMIRPNLLADLDQMDSLMPEILARIFPERAPPAAGPARNVTSARQKWRSLLSDPATVARITEFYAGDFEAFGYPTDIDADPQPAQAVQRSEHRHEMLGRFLRYQTAEPADKAARLRDIEKNDPEGGMAAFVLAMRLRHNQRNPERVALLMDQGKDVLVNPPAFLSRAVTEVSEIAASVAAGAA